MTSIADGSVDIQTTSESNISIPSWFGEVVLISRYLQKHNVLNKINEQVRGCRGNGRYREELRKGLATIRRYLTAYQLEASRTRLASRWALWQWSCALRCGWVRVCDARQRL